MGNVAENLSAIRGRIREAAEKYGRKHGDIRLIAVGKNQAIESLKEAYDAGQRIFGENYVQELRYKSKVLSETIDPSNHRPIEPEWHFIGHLQRNKVKYIVPITKCIHSIDSVQLAEEIEKRARTKIDCLIEINLAGEASKTGISKDEAVKLIEALKPMEHLNLIGLMTMPPYDPEPEKARPYFKELKELLHKINAAKIYPRELTELSMGMTGDLEVAIEEGSTMVRVGTGIFGERTAL